MISQHQTLIINDHKHNTNKTLIGIQCYQAKGEKVEIHIFLQVNGILIAEMLMHFKKITLYQN